MGTEVRTAPSVFGPYHRLESPSQTKQVAAMQVASQSIWGKIAKWGYVPAVKAYWGSLPLGARGIEFTTSVPPRKNSHPMLVDWPEGLPGVRDEGNGYVSIPVNVTVNTQV